MQMDDVVIMGLTLWREASGEGVVGMAAVANVIWNRAKKANTSVYAQCVAQNQFTSISVKGDPGTVRWPRQSDDVYKAALQIAQNFANVGQVNDPTGGALFYANLKTATSGWFHTNIVEDPETHPMKAVIGNHTFFA